MFHKETHSISPTQIIQVAYADQYRYPDPQTAIIGRHQHSRIGGLLRRGIEQTLPGFQTETIFSDLNGPAQTEKKVSRWLSDSLALHATLDLLVGKQFVVEIKPTVRKTHLVQLMLNCLAASKNRTSPGALYCYTGQEEAHVLEYGGSEMWPEGTKLCELAHTLLQCQQEIDLLNHQKQLKNKSYRHQTILPGMSVTRDQQSEITYYAQKAVDTRADFDALFNTTASALIHLAKPISLQ